MDSKFKVITLCGSTRFKEDYIRVHKELTLAGNIVISVGLFGHQGDDEVWEGRSEGNVYGYIGESTKREIAYAKACGKKVRSFVPIPENEYADKSVLKVLIDGKVRDFIKDVAKDSGRSESFVDERFIKEYNNLLKKGIILKINRL